MTKIYYVTLVTLLLAVSCHQGPQPATTRAPDDPVAEDAADVVVLEPDLTGAITVPGNGVRARRLLDGRLQVQARLVNSSGDPLTIQIQAVFKDGEGFATEEASPWTHYILSEGDLLNYQCTSINAKATSYVVKVRRAEG